LNRALNWSFAFLALLKVVMLYLRSRLNRCFTFV
jgi:hypothetical protein